MHRRATSFLSWRVARGTLGFHKDRNLPAGAGTATRTLDNKLFRQKIIPPRIILKPNPHKHFAVTNNLTQRYYAYLHLLWPNIWYAKNVTHFPCHQTIRPNTLSRSGKPLSAVGRTRQPRRALLLSPSLKHALLPSSGPILVLFIYVCPAYTGVRSVWPEYY